MGVREMKKVVNVLFVAFIACFLALVTTVSVNAATNEKHITIQYYGEGHIQVRDHQEFSFKVGSKYDLTKYAYPTAISVFGNVETPIASISKVIYNDDEKYTEKSREYGTRNDIDKLFKGTIYHNELINVYYEVPGYPSNNDESEESETYTSYGKLYRLYNKNSGEHFYTSDYDEYLHLIEVGWKNENVAWNPPLQGENVYRLYNPNSGEHFFTTNKEEYNQLEKSGWKQEGVAFYSYDKTKTDAIPVYRLFNPNAKNAGSHHFTISGAEQMALVSAGWKDEGIAFYAVGF